MSCPNCEDLFEVETEMETDGHLHAHRLCDANTATCPMCGYSQAL